MPDEDDEEAPDDGEEGDDEEDVIDEDNVFAVEGKICTISIGACRCCCCCCCSSDLLLMGELSGVLVTKVGVEPGGKGGRALSIELNSAAGTSCCSSWCSC